MNLHKLLEKGPLFHRDVDGRRTSWRLSHEVLAFIDGHVRPGMNTLETGEGLSTVVFAMRGANHLCVSPNDEAIDLIQAFCRKEKVSLKNVKFPRAYSDDFLPSAKLPPLDLVLIDGGHGFPVPFIDWYFTAGALKKGGIVIVDDTQIWTGTVLRDFLEAEPSYRLVEQWPGRCAAFEKVSETTHRQDWYQQPYVRDWAELPRLNGQDRERYVKFARAVDFLRSGQYGQFARKLVKNAPLIGGLLRQ